MRRRALVGALLATPACAQTPMEARVGAPVSLPLPPGGPELPVLEVTLRAHTPASRGNATVAVRLLAPDGSARAIGRIAVFPTAAFTEADPPRAYRFRLPDDLPRDTAGWRVVLSVEGTGDPGARFRFAPPERRPVG
jgi:hypothetical protein